MHTSLTFWDLALTSLIRGVPPSRPLARVSQRKMVGIFDPAFLHNLPDIKPDIIQPRCLHLVRPLRACPLENCSIRLLIGKRRHPRVYLSDMIRFRTIRQYLRDSTRECIDIPRAALPCLDVKLFFVWRQ